MYLRTEDIKFSLEKNFYFYIVLSILPGWPLSFLILKLFHAIIFN